MAQRPVQTPKSVSALKEMHRSEADFLLEIEELDEQARQRLGVPLATTCSNTRITTK